ncbi:hypothetical protein SACC_13130 [Saccharolobus caldissimus]|uniref:Uncharacterized protein n=1 Tax=Saccharolobus caldissimus TaxID=1702097 RepID=A0AAQ4CR65_9CREN|nr:hypothetical protein SACC_13130 [Saccharolobus caldissimus]
MLYLNIKYKHTLGLVNVLRDDSLDCLEVTNYLITLVLCKRRLIRIYI